MDAALKVGRMIAGGAAGYGLKGYVHTTAVLALAGTRRISPLQLLLMVAVPPSGFSEATGCAQLP